MTYEEAFAYIIKSHDVAMALLTDGKEDRKFAEAIEVVRQDHLRRNEK